MNQPSWMDEFLCEYVDDTMDCSVRAAFEECVQQDAKLAQHIKRLRGTHSLLCQCRCRTPSGLRSRVKKRLSQCLPLSNSIRPPHSSILIGTAVAIALSVALVAGITRSVRIPLSSMPIASHSIALDYNANNWRINRVYAKKLNKISQFGALSSEV